MCETTSFCCVALWPIILVFILVISSSAVAGGALGLLSDRKRRGNLWKLSILVIVVGAIPLLLYGLSKIIPDPPSPTPEPIYRPSDENVEPFLRAMNQSKRLALGFSVIPSDAQVELQYYDYNSRTQAFIYINPQTGWGYITSWTVYFEKIDNEYKWIGEQEVYAGLNRYENIYIHYSVKEGWPYITRPGDKPANTLVVEYRGEDHRLLKPNLTLEDIKPILVEWKEEWITLKTEK